MIDKRTKIKVDRLDTIKRLKDKREQLVAEAKEKHADDTTKYKEAEKAQAAWERDVLKAAKSAKPQIKETWGRNRHAEVTYEVDAPEAPRSFSEPPTLEKALSNVRYKYDHIITRLEMAVDDTLSISVGDIEGLL